MSPEDLHQDYSAWATGVMTSGADVLHVVDGLMMVVGRMTVGEDFSVRGLNRVLHEVQSLVLPEDPEDKTAARLAGIVDLIRLRLNLYAAHLGDPAAAARIASWSAGNALANLHRTGSWAVLVAALAWAERSAIAHAVAPSYGPSLGLPDVDDVIGEAFAHQGWSGPRRGWLPHLPRFRWSAPAMPTAKETAFRQCGAARLPSTRRRAGPRW